MKPTHHPEAEGCAWCGRPATFWFIFRFKDGWRLVGKKAFACDLHIANARRLCVIRVAAIEVPS